MGSGATLGGLTRRGSPASVRGTHLELARARCRPRAARVIGCLGSMAPDERAPDRVEATDASGPGVARAFAVALALAVLLPLAAYLWLGARNLNISDEGFLWYGVRATQAGEVPMRDFQAYDPGRYHFCAALAPLFGDGVRGLRASLAVFQALGLLCALRVAQRVARGWPWQLFVALVLMLWMFPRHKLFEPSLAAMACWVAVRLVERPSRARHLATGVFVGLAGYFGRNLGLYCGLATGALVLFVAWKQRAPDFARRAGAWALGVALGYAPMLAMFAFVPGFAAAFGDSLRAILVHGANIARPWPWPWRVELAGVPPEIAFRNALLAVAFLVPVLTLPGVLLAALRTRASELPARAACIASAVVALFFLHHASVNSGAWHLAQCSPPFLLALLALPQLSGARRRGVAVAVCSGLALVTLAFGASSNPDLNQTLGRRFVSQRVGAETLELSPRHAQVLAGIQGALASTVGDERVFLAPNLAAFYCVLGKRSPSWWLFFFWDATPAEEQELLDELAGVDWALIMEPAREDQERRFSDSHPIVWRQFQRQWSRIAAPGLPPDFVLFRRR